MENLAKTFIQAEQLLISERNCEELVESRLAANRMKSTRCKSTTMRCAMMRRRKEAKNNDTNKHEMHIKESNFRCSNRLTRIRSDRITMLIGVSLCLLLHSANAWHFFDSTNPETRLYNSLQPLNLLAAPSPPINLPTQHLKPISHMSQNQNNNNNNNMASSVATAQMISDQPQASFGAKLASSIVNNLVQSEPTKSNQEQQVAKEAPKQLEVSSSDKDANLARDSSSQSESTNDKQVTDGSTSPAKTRQPKPAGKILEALAAVVAHESVDSVKQHQPEANQTSIVEKAGQQVVAAVASQLLRPRKTSQDSSRQASSSAEQQIINQHAKVYLTPHQRIGGSLATKHRGSSVSDKMAISFFGDSSAGGRDSSPLGSIFSNFKTGITSRSSIVKAISDNKLARTLSEVSKTIGGNKYVAGAAAASALAALGLTMSKLLSPYLFAGAGYQKLGDPMLMSSSMMSTSADRQYPASIYANNANFMQTLPSTPAMFYPMQSSQAPFNQASELATAETSAPVFDFGPQSSANQQFQASQPRDYYYTYSPRPIVNAKTSAGQSDINGLYTPFYGSSSASAGQKEFPSSAASNQQQQQQVNYNEQSSVYPPTYDSNPPYAQQPSVDVQPPQQFDQQENQANANFQQPSSAYPRYNQNSAGTSRRSGAVSLKMNEATKARLQKQLQRQHSRRQVEHYLPAAPTSSYAPAAIRPSSDDKWLASEGAFIPMSSSASEPSGDFVVRPGKVVAKSQEASMVAGEANGIGERHASLVNEKPQQGQSMPKTTGLTYMIIRPKKTTILGAKSPLTARQLETNDLTAGQVSSSRPGNSWRSPVVPASSWFVADPVKQEQPSYSNSEEFLQSAASSLNGQLQQHQQVFGEPKLGRSRAAMVATSGASTSNAQESPQASRLSRTGMTNQSSGVKGVARRPSESLTDYGTVESVASVADGQTGAATKPPSTTEMTGEPNRLTSGRTSSGSGEQAITTLGGLHETAPSSSSSSSFHEASSMAGQSAPVNTAASGGSSSSSGNNNANNSDDAKTNLIQLSESENDANNNNGNNVKLIENSNANNEPSGGQRAQYESAGSLEEGSLVNGSPDVNSYTDDHNDHQHRHQQLQQPNNHQQSHNTAQQTNSADEDAMKTLVVARERPFDS